MGITVAQPRRGPSQSVPPAPNGNSEFPIQSSPKFQQSINNNKQQPGNGLPSNQRAIPVSEVYFDMIQDDDDDDDVDETDDDSDEYEDDEAPSQPAICPPMVHDVTTGAIFHIVDNPVYCNDLPRPKVGPLTPLEIAEYQKCGIELRRPKPQPIPTPLVPPRTRPPCRNRKFKCKSFITVEPNDRCASPVRRRRSSSRPPRACSELIADERPVPLVFQTAYECLTAYEIDYAKMIFYRICSPDDSKVSFSGFLKLCRRMSPRLTQQRSFMHRAAYHFRLADSDCDGRIAFEEFLFAYVQAREAASAGTIGALDSGCSMNERPVGLPRSRGPPMPPPRRRKPRYRCVPVPVTRYRPDYLNELDRKSVPLRDLANQINSIYDI